MAMGSRRARTRYPTQANGTLEWGTQLKITQDAILGYLYL
jgi:hypothetical protein